MHSTRRQLFANIASAALLSQAAKAAEDPPIQVTGKRAMILHNDRPEDLETPARSLGIEAGNPSAAGQAWLTPIELFYVRQHLPRPAKIEPDAYKLAIGGMVSKPQQLTLEELRKLPQFTVPATLECAGNGRAFFSPKVPGIQWSRGAIGNAEWRGPRLSDVLAAAGVSTDANYIDFDGADIGFASTPDFIRSLPMKKALHPATILALSMNGQTPEIHGFPARLVVPGWDGASWVKWVVRISAQAQAYNGFYMNPAYRYPTAPVAPGSPVRPGETAPIEGMPVKSAICFPEDNGKIPQAPTIVRGYAWAGENAIERVEVSFDGGSRWRDAQLSRDKLPFAWRLWSTEWRPNEPGYYNILSRATDTAGRVQPVVSAWNPSGYLWNAIDRVGVNVEKSA